MNEIKLNEEQARELSNAVILLAAEDYRKAYNEYINSSKLLEDTRTFFGSDWAQLLAGDLNLKDVFAKLEAEAKAKAENSEEYKQLVHEFTRQKIKNSQSRLRVFSDNGVIYVFNVGEGKKQEIANKAMELIADLAIKGFKKRKGRHKKNE